MEFLSSKDLKEALELKARHPDYVILSGGTDLCTSINSGLVKPSGMINIWGLSGLSEIKEDGDRIEIGALATHTKIIESVLVKKYLPVLARACKTIGARQIQNRGTIGGNVMNASPAGDTLPVLLAYDAEVEVTGLNGQRRIKFSEFYKGYRKTALATSEIVTAFKVPKAKSGERADFLKVGTRKAQAISKVMGCFRLMLDGDVIRGAAIAFGSVAAVPVRCPKTEGFLQGAKLNDVTIEKAVKLVMEEVSPIDDIRSTGAYRRHVAGVILKRFLAPNHP